MKSRLFITLALVAAALGLAAWAAMHAWRGSAAPRYPGANVLLVTIDTLRADRLGAYGYGPAETPRIDRLARQGVHFKQVVSPMPLTLPSHTSLMTALSTAEHGVRDNGAFELAPAHTTLAERLTASGYESAAFVAAFVLHSRWGLARGFAHYDDDFEYDQPGGIPGQVERRAEAVVDAALAWLREPRQPREAPFLAWVHLYDPHAPYAAPESWDSRFPGRPYDAEVAYTDAQIGRLLDGLEAAGTLENTLVVITADHGEGLGEHGEPGHGMFLYDTTLMVPLVIRLPDAQVAGREVAEQVRLIDVAPTILELVGVMPPDSYAGESLTPFFSGVSDPRPAYSETYYPRWHFGWQELHSLRQEGFKYILAPRDELYDLAADPAESRNLADELATRSEAFRDEVEELRGDGAASGSERLSGETAARLRALGYLSGAPAEVAEGPLADPKDKMHLFTRTTEAQGMLIEGEYAGAVEALRGVIEEDPRIVAAQLTLGNSLFRLGQYAAAAEAFQATLDLSPANDLALSNLGLAHRRLGDAETARADFEALLSLDPSSTSAHFNLGEMALEDEDPVAAERHFEAAIRIDDQQPGPQFGLGVAAYQQGQIQRASAQFDRVLALAPAYLEIHYYRALIAESRGDAQAAADLYRAELEINPFHHRSWLNLSQIQAGLGDHQEAVRSLRRAIEVEPERAPAHVLLARSLVALEDPAVYAEAEAAARRGLGLDPPPELRPLAHYVLADIYNRLGRPADVQRQLALAREAERAIRR